MAIKWLKWLSETEDLDIQHARNGGEVRFGNYKFDGQLRTDQSVVFELYGCVRLLQLFFNPSQQISVLGVPRLCDMFPEPSQ